jgi:hypothetical protein
MHLVKAAEPEELAWLIAPWGAHVDEDAYEWARVIYGALPGRLAQANLRRRDERDPAAARHLSALRSRDGRPTAASV